MKILSCKKMKYLINYPSGYTEGKKYPIIIFLHGAGTRGTDINVLKRNSFFSITGEYESFPFISVAPLCSENTWFDMLPELKALVKKIAESDFADAERIYLMGNSMGGYATWQLAMSIPEYFAAIIPICGGGMYWNTARLKNIPVWAFHGEIDKCVFADESIKMVEHINKKGGNAKLTVYPDTPHTCWDITYKNYEVFEWLLSHKRNNGKANAEDFSDSKTYG